MPIKGVHRVAKPLANGSVRYYYRTARQGGVTFWECDDTPLDLNGKRLPAGFIEAYTDALDVERGVTPSSFEQAFHEYQKKSAKFKSLVDKSRETRVRYLTAWLDMKIRNGQLARTAPLAIFDHKEVVPYIVEHRDETWGHSLSSAHEAMIALSAFLTWCMGVGKLDSNKVSAIEKQYERPADKARIWSDGEIAAFMTAAPWQLEHFLELALFTGLRLQDAIRLPVTALKEEHIIIPTGKSRGATNAIVPITPPLRTLLKRIETRRKKLKASPTTLLFNSKGRPWSKDGSGLATSFYKIRDRVFEHTTDRPTIHDLRKTAATRMVILQKRYPKVITDGVLTDMFGWTPGTLAKMKRIYVSDAAVITAMTAGNRTEQKR